MEREWGNLKRLFDDTAFHELLDALCCNAYLHHQISWCIVNLLQYYPDRNPAPLKDKAVRDKLVYVLFQLTDNHAYMLHLIKQYLHKKRRMFLCAAMKIPRYGSLKRNFLSDLPYPYVNHPAAGLDELVSYPFCAIH